MGKFRNFPSTFWYEILGCYKGYHEDHFILRSENNKEEVIHVPVSHLVKIKYENTEITKTC